MYHRHYTSNRVTQETERSRCNESPCATRDLSYTNPVATLQNLHLHSPNTNTERRKISGTNGVAKILRVPQKRDKNPKQQRTEENTKLEDKSNRLASVLNTL